MASIGTGGSGHGGKKSVDHDIPLVPFIDLLLCCIMFLLVTAVWNQLASVNANLNAPGNPTETIDLPDRPTNLLTVQIQHTGYRLATTAGDETLIPTASGAYDVTALRAHLQHRQALDPSRDQVVMTADDGVHYADVMQAMDAFAGSGYGNVTITEAL